VTSSATYRVKLEVNGQVVEVEVAGRQTLLDLLRDQLGLTGTHAGCEHGSCGACTVTLDGELIRACLMLAVQSEGHAVGTIEAVAAGAELHPVQAAFQRHHALQCGFCTPGMVLTAIDVLARHPAPTPEVIRQALAGNLCRCTGYDGLVAAIVEAAIVEAAKPPPQP
jgi:aerobic-type carbon monoxide dehydrogenase small subunit (CoxS/CutS family)